MAPQHDLKDDMALNIPEHIGTPKGFPSTGNYKDATKSKHLQEAEMVLRTPNCPAMTLKVGCMPLRQEAKLRDGKNAKKLNMSRHFIHEGIMHQSRADNIHRTATACSYCQDGNGLFSACRTLTGFRDGCCANCMVSGDGYKRCSFIPDDIRNEHKRKVDAAETSGGDTINKKQKPMQAYGKAYRGALRECADHYEALAAACKKHYDGLAELHEYLADIHLREEMYPAEDSVHSVEEDD